MVLLLVLPRAWGDSKIQLFEINYGKNKWLSLVSSPLPPNILVFIRPTNLTRTKAQIPNLNSNQHTSPCPISEQQDFSTTNALGGNSGFFNVHRPSSPLWRTIIVGAKGLCVSPRVHLIISIVFQNSISHRPFLSSTAPIISYLPLHAQINILTTRVCNPHIFYRQRQ